MNSDAVNRRGASTIARQLELCRVTPKETAVVLAVDDTDAGLMDSALRALIQVGTRPTAIVIDSLPLANHRAAVAAVAAADVVVSLIGSDPFVQKGLAGKHPRVLSVLANTNADLRGLVPHSGLDRRMGRGQDLFKASTALHVTGASGTDLRIDLANAKPWGVSGVAAAHGVIAEWPVGAVGTTLSGDVGEGTVVMAPGDIWLPMGWYARSQITLKFKGGVLTDIGGSPSETDAVQALLDDSHSPYAHRLSAVDIGLLWIDRHQPPERFEPGYPQSLSVAHHQGHVVISTGSRQKSGISCCLRTATVTADEVAAVIAGQLQGELAPDIYEQAAH